MVETPSDGGVSVKATPLGCERGGYSIPTPFASISVRCVITHSRGVHKVRNLLLQRINPAMRFFDACQTIFPRFGYLKRPL